MRTPFERCLVIVAFFVIAGGIAGCRSHPPIDEPERPASVAVRACTADDPVARLAPASGAYFGVNLDWATDSPEKYTARLGSTPAVFVLFTGFPQSSDEAKNLDSAVDAVARARAALLLTLEPTNGLHTVTPASADELATRLARYNARGVPIFVRFAHEMNGSWYAWAQQPKAYVASFRTLAEAVHRKATLSAMVWAPNYGGGYPFAAGAFKAQPGTAEFARLDTNGDGVLTMADDPYSPYYAGDDAVDWVGMSLYHWGNRYPWGENERPEPGKFMAQLRGTYNGLGGDDSAVPDFYAIFAEGHRKPLSITETAAFFEPGEGGDSAALIKEDWRNQTFASLAALPEIKMVNWFEWYKFESEVQHQVDWTATREKAMAAQFKAAMPTGLGFAGDLRVCRPGAGGRSP